MHTILMFQSFNTIGKVYKNIKIELDKGIKNIVKSLTISLFVQIDRKNSNSTSKQTIT